MVVMRGADLMAMMRARGSGAGRREERRCYQDGG